MSLLDMFGFSWVILDVDWLLFWILLRSSLGEASKDAISAPVKGQERSRVSMSSFLLGPSRHCFFFPDILDASFFPIETAIFQIFPDGAVEHIKAICRPLQHLDGTGSQQIFWRHRQPEVAKQDWD